MGIDKATLGFKVYHVQHRSCCRLDQQPICLDHKSQYLQRNLSSCLTWGCGRLSRATNDREVCWLPSSTAVAKPMQKARTAVLINCAENKYHLEQRDCPSLPVPCHSYLVFWLPVRNLETEAWPSSEKLKTYAPLPFPTGKNAQYLKTTSTANRTKALIPVEEADSGAY